MPAHSRRATDPTPPQLRALLDEVYRQAAHDFPIQGYDPREGPPTIDDTPPSWNELLGLAAELAQGVYARRYRADWRMTPLRFGACWWTDIVGRRHWLIQADTDTNPFTIGAAAEEFGQGSGLIDGRHPLEWIAPALAVGHRNQGRNRRLIVACRCGFAGEPDALAWTGSMCGPCFDREQEGLAPAGPPPLRPEVGLLSAFRLLNDGRLIGANAVGETGVRLRVWDPPWSGKPRWGREWSEHLRWAVSPSGLLALETTPGRVTLVGLGDGRTRDSRELRVEGQLRHLAFAGKKGELLIGNFIGPRPALGGLLRAWSVSEEGTIGAPVYLREHDKIHTLSVSPRGQRLVVSRGRTLDVLDADDGERNERLSFSETGNVCLSLALPDGAILATTHLDDVGPPAMVRWEPRRSAAPVRGLFGWAIGPRGRGPDIRVSLNGVCEALVPSPDGRFLASVEDDLVLRDVHSLQELGRFRPACCELYPSLGFSADGQLVALTNRGLAAWPWKELFGIK